VTWEARSGFLVTQNPKLAALQDLETSDFGKWTLQRKIDNLLAGNRIPFELMNRIYKITSKTVSEIASKPDSKPQPPN
jgi:hypothetical protein